MFMELFMLCMSHFLSNLVSNYFRCKWNIENVLVELPSYKKSAHAHFKYE